jgi:uncharacterized protein with NAD-binding domain and iron-sulfur cluster
MVRDQGKSKIAILGGGVGALAAAFDLTEVDPDGKLYDITIYQVGWRLGGKGAVGWTCKDYPTPGFEDERVQLEHGLHVWAGFYDNAFDLLQRCYAAHGSYPSSYLDAFTPVNRCWVMEGGTGAGARWELDVPPNGRIPGISRLAPSSTALWGRLLALVTKASHNEPLRTHVEKAAGRIPLRLSAQTAQFASKARQVADGLANYPMGIGPAQRARFRELVNFATEHLHEEYFDERQLDGGLAEDVRRQAIMVNIGIALLLGMLDCKVLVEGFDRIDRWEWSSWMENYGAWTMSLRSGLVRAFYDYVFGFDCKGRPAVGAGTSIRAFLHLLCAYKGSLFYKLNVTMGEFLFAPLYEVLLKRGVKFQFFSRVDKLHLSQDKKNIEQIDIGLQAHLLDQSKSYQPLIDAPGQMKTWPDRPNYAQLKDGDQIYAKLLQDKQDLESPWNCWGVVDTISLRRDKGDFDKVILGIGLGALKDICFDLCNEPTLAWGKMVRKVLTCPTLATQLWVNQPTSSFGWPAENTVITAFASPLNTWGDNSQLVAQELWTTASPASLAYLVGNLLPDDRFPTPGKPDPFPVTQLEKATAQVATWLRDDLPVLWPGFQKAYLALDPYVRVNVNPSDRYVQSVPGSVESRLRPDGSGVDNLYLAGDWVRVGLNAVCIEHAVLGGRAAARAITGVDMNSSYDNDRNWNDDGPVSPPLTALLSNLPDLTRLALAGVGRVEARCIVHYVSPAVIEAMLPPGLTLNLPKTQLEKLPICLVFSAQRNVRPGFVPFGGIGYLEFSIVLHDVYNQDTNDDYNGPFVYMPRILLNSFAPAAIGVKAYGFSKRLARMRHVGDSFNIRNSEGEISARFEDASLLGQICDFPALSIVRRILDQPVISETSEGGWIVSYFDYHLDQAGFQSLKGLCSINQGPYSEEIEFIGVPGRSTSGVAAANVASQSLGFRMVTNWDITLPMRVGEHDGLLPTPKRMHAAATTNRLLARLRGRR